MELNKKVEGILGLSAIDDAMGATTENLTFGQVHEMFTAPVTTFQKPRKTTFALGNETGEVTDDFSQIYMSSKAILGNKGRITKDIVIKAILEWSDIPKYFNRFAGPTTRSAVEMYKNPGMEMKPLPGAVIVDYTSKTTSGAAMKIAPAGILHPGNLEATIDNAIVIAQVTHDNSLAISGTCTVAAATSASPAGEAAIKEAISAGVYGATRGETKAKSVSGVVTGISVVERIKLALQIAEGAGSKEEKLLKLSQIVGNGLHISEVVPCAFGTVALNKDDALQAVVNAVSIGHGTGAIAAIVGMMVGAFVDFEGKNLLDLYDKVQKANGIDPIILADELTIAAKIG